MTSKQTLTALLVGGIAALIGIALSKGGMVEQVGTTWWSAGTLFAGSLIGFYSATLFGGPSAEVVETGRRTLYVGNMPFSTTEGELRAAFGVHGQVYSVKLLTDRYTGRPRGVGFVEMDQAAAQKAMQAMNGSDLGGRTIKVNEAGPNRNRKSGPRPHRQFQRRATGA